MATFKFNEAGMDRFLAQAKEKLEKQFNEALRETVRQVRDEMAGRPTEEIYDELVRRITARMPTFTVNETNLRRYAQAIHDNKLTG